MNIDPYVPNLYTLDDRLSFWRDKLSLARRDGDLALEERAHNELAQINTDTVARNTQPRFSEG